MGLSFHEMHLIWENIPGAGAGYPGGKPVVKSFVAQADQAPARCNTWRVEILIQALHKMIQVTVKMIQFLLAIN